MSEWIDIGEQLRDARARQNLELMDVAHQTRIPLATLSALEKNDYSVFPSPAYARSFLAQYSDFLKVDAHDWIDAFDTGDVLANVREHSYLQNEHDRIGEPRQGHAAPRHGGGSARQHQYQRMSAEVSGKSNILQTLTVLFVTGLLIAGGIYAYKKYEPMLTGDRAPAHESADAAQPDPAPTVNVGDRGNSITSGSLAGSINPAVSSSSLMVPRDFADNTGGGNHSGDPKNQITLQVPKLIQPNRSGPPPKALVIDENED